MMPFLGHNRRPVFLRFAWFGFLCALLGCQSLPQSGFDPYGERLFESRPFANCPLFNWGSDSTPTTVSSTPIPSVPQESTGASIFAPPSAALPGDLGASQTNLAGSTATTLPPGTHAITTALIHNPDAGPTPVFANTGGYALPTAPVTGPDLFVTPREQIAPLGSEVVLIASRLGNKDRLVTNEKVEWALEGVGTIEKIDGGSYRDTLVFDYVHAKKVTDRYAITKTSQVYQTLNRGTTGTSDDVHLLRGQTWVSVNSLKEGTTHVTAFAPNMADWSKRTDGGIIHWVDAQWVLPRLAIAPVGEDRVLTTTVLRATNGQPRQGWIVRYEILSGPSAGLGASGAQIEEVATDSSGQATTILTPGGQTAGTNSIGIRIIRPAGVDGDRRVTVGSEIVRQTWSGNPSIVLNIRGPNEARLGQELPYEITATNRTSATVQGVVALPIPPLASYIRSEPPGLLQGTTVLWNVTLLPGNTERMSVVLRQGTAGSLWLRPEFRRTGQIPTTRIAPTQISTTQSPTPLPSSSAAVFPGTQTTPPPAPATQSPAPSPAQPPSGVTPPPPATTFQARPTLTVQIEPETSVHPIVSGESFRFYVRVVNTGTTDARDLAVIVPLPEEFPSSSCGGDWSTDWEFLEVEGRERSTAGKPSDWRFGTDERNHQVALMAPLLAPGKSAYLLLQYPRIDSQGHNITCIVFADNQEITRASRRIVP